MGRAALANIGKDMPNLASEGMETEVFAHGRIPLAYSARCFTARRYHLQKDSCEFRCIKFPDGLNLKTREGADFLTINGIQTMSARVYHLERELPELVAAGVKLLRLSPQSDRMTDIIGAYRALIDSNSADMPTGDYCNGFWHEQPGLDWITT